MEKNATGMLLLKAARDQGKWSAVTIPLQPGMPLMCGEVSPWERRILLVPVHPPNTEGGVGGIRTKARRDEGWRGVPATHGFSRGFA